MPRILLVLLPTLLAVIAAGCTQDESTGTGDEGPGSGGSDAAPNATNITSPTQSPDSAPSPSVAGMCVEGAEDCDDMIGVEQ